MNDITYKVEGELIKVSFTGEIDIAGITKLMNEIDVEMKLNEELRIIVDSREATYLTRPSDLQGIVYKLKEFGKRFKLIRLAIIQQRPYETAISMIMFDMLKGIYNIHCNVCSTDEKANEWVQ